MGAAIEISGLTKRYGERRGVEGISLSVPEGSLYGFLGPNGAGKTTTIRVLLGLLRATAGEARVLGLDCWRRSAAVKASLGYLPGDLRLYPWLSGESALRMVGRVRGQNLEPAGRELGERFDLDLSVRVRRMSRGMRQKLGLVLAMAHRPRVLILDEPTSGLDPLMQDALHESLRRCVREGCTVFFSSHSLAEVERLCDRVAIVREGKLVADEVLEALRRRAGHEVEIRWQDGVAVGGGGPAPEFLRVYRRDGRTWSGVLHGDVESLVRWLAERRGVADLKIGPPDLESLFRRYYEQGGGGGESEAGR